MPKGGILYLIMVFAPWEAIIKYNVLSPMGVFVLGGIYVVKILIAHQIHVNGVLGTSVFTNCITICSLTYIVRLSSSLQLNGDSTCTEKHTREPSEERPLSE